MFLFTDYLGTMHFYLHIDMDLSKHILPEG